MALTIGEANAAAHLIHALQGDDVKPEHVIEGALDLDSRIYKALMARPNASVAGITRTLAILAAVPELVDDLLRMDAETAVELDRWPAARALVDAWTETES